jgi:alginate O-acetyltransferase complex protein AlgJ
MPRTRRRADRGLTALFLLLLAAPLPLGLALRAGASRSASDSPSGAEAWLTDRLAGRDALVRGAARIKLHGLGVSTTPRVTLGTDGWLFLRPEAEPNYLRPDDPALDARLRRWRSALLARRDWLAARGIRYVVVVAPEKSSVYPECLPAADRRPAPTPLDRLLASLSDDATGWVLDLREPLLRAKAGGGVYYRTDTHWNDRGGRAAAAAVLTALADWFPELTPAGDDLPPAGTEDFNHGDLARLLGLDGELHEDVPRFRESPRRARRSAIDGPSGSRLDHLRAAAWMGGSGEVPGLVLFHDSFGTAGGFAEELAERCGRLTAIPTYGFERDWVGRERPAVVVQQFAERVLQGMTPKE